MSSSSLDNFDSALKEAELPDLSQWQFFVETHGLKIYRLYREVMYLNLMIPVLYCASLFNPPCCELYRKYCSKSLIKIL